MSHYRATLRRPTTRHTRRTCCRRGLGRLIAVTSLALVTALVVATPASANAPAASPRAAEFEVQFLEDMIDHHQMALHMGELCLEKAVHDELGGLCETIIASQAAEIEAMQGWLSGWYGIDHEPMMNDPAHHQQMEELGRLSGAQFEIAFLQMMSEHHAMAVGEGLQCLRSAEHSELRGLCGEIVVTQLAEIAQMERWLCRWYGDCRFTYLRSARGLKLTGLGRRTDGFGSAGSEAMPRAVRRRSSRCRRQRESRKDYWSRRRPSSRSRGRSGGPNDGVTPTRSIRTKS